MHVERLASHIPQNDFVELHRIWSYTPRGIWRSTDLPYSARFSADYSYRVAYVPRKLQAGSCHHVKVSVDRAHAKVVATQRYCYIPHPATDPLAGTELSRSMQPELTSNFVYSDFPLSAQVGFFYSGANEATVEITLEFLFEKLRCNWRNSEHGNWSYGCSVGDGWERVRSFQ